VGISEKLRFSGQPKEDLSSNERKKWPKTIIIRVGGVSVTTDTPMKYVKRFSDIFPDTP
jgi:hypothetical protein